MMFVGTRLSLIPGIPPVNLPENHRITKSYLKQNTPTEKKRSPLLEALKYADVLQEPSVETFSQVGMRFNVSRARVSQMLSLLNLNESIKEYICSIDDAQKHNFFTERKLRNIAIIKDKKEQNSRFRKLIEDIDLTF
ncbi:hypothetical protein KKA94_02915 [Patescibacteria group bacterium]|nr:hypothetical protein [Patescibacteria group bacterium]